MLAGNRGKVKLIFVMKVKMNMVKIVTKKCNNIEKT